MPLSCPPGGQHVIFLSLQLDIIMMVEEFIQETCLDEKPLRLTTYRSYHKSLFYLVRMQDGFNSVAPVAFFYTSACDEVHQSIVFELNVNSTGQHCKDQGKNVSCRR